MVNNKSMCISSIICTTAAAYGGIIKISYPLEENCGGRREALADDRGGGAASMASESAAYAHAKARRSYMRNCFAISIKSMAAKHRELEIAWQNGVNAAGVIVAYACHQCLSSGAWCSDINGVNQNSYCWR